MSELKAMTPERALELCQVIQRSRKEHAGCFVAPSEIWDELQHAGFLDVDGTVLDGPLRALAATVATPPRSTDRPWRSLSLSGMLMGWAEGQPCLMRVMGSDAWHLALFSTLDKLETAHDEGWFEYESIKVVDDGNEFLESLPKEIAVILDPYITEKGTMRYFQVEGTIDTTGVNVPMRVRGQAS